MSKKEHWVPDNKRKIKYCDRCGEVIRDWATTKVYSAGGPYYDDIYICEECQKIGKGVYDDGK